jgi:hypothetical protein
LITTDAVDVQLVLALEVLHRILGLGTEVTIGIGGA